MKIKDAFESFFVWQEKIGMRPKTIENDRYYLKHSIVTSIADMEVADLKKTDVAKVIEAGRSCGKYGPQRGVVMLRKILRYLKETGETIPFRWQDIKIPHVPQRKVEYLTEDELERLFRAVNLKDPAGLRTRTLLECLYASGMRIGEAVALDITDVDFENKEALITNVKSKVKNEKVYFSDRALFWLRRYIKSRKDRHPALFISNGTRLTQDSSEKCLRRLVQPMAASLGIAKHITHHIFRKTFVTHLLQRKADIMAVKDLARHRSERTTLKNYAGVDKERSKAIHAGIMNNLLG